MDIQAKVVQHWAYILTLQYVEITVGNTLYLSGMASGAVCSHLISNLSGPLGNCYLTPLELNMYIPFFIHRDLEDRKYLKDTRIQK